MEQHDNIALLKQIERVDVPPFLLTRIEAKIAALREMYVKPRWVIATGLAFATIVLLNVLVINKEQRPDRREDAVEGWSGALELNTSNQLYNE